MKINFLTAILLVAFTQSIYANTQIRAYCENRQKGYFFNIKEPHTMDSKFLGSTKVFAKIRNINMSYPNSAFEIYRDGEHITLYQSGELVGTIRYREIRKDRNVEGFYETQNGNIIELRCGQSLSSVRRNM